MTSLTAVRPVRPAAGYQGGKRNLARRIIDAIGTIDHTSYAEPFVGMGGVFLRRVARPRAETINDISGDIANFFRILQTHYAYFIDLLRFRVASRNEFERLLSSPPETLTDLHRAVRFLYLQKLAFGGKVSGRTFGVDANQGARFNLLKLEPLLADIHERLQGVTIEQLPYGDFIRRYDRPGALFYLGPPYAGGEDDYGPGVFSPGDFATLADLLAAIRGRFLLSINDTPEIRAVFANFHIAEVETTWTVGGGAGKPVVELLISSEAISDP